MGIETVTLSEDLQSELARAAEAAGVPYRDFVVDSLWRAAREDGRLVVDGRARAAAARAAAAVRKPLAEWVEDAIRAKLAAGPTRAEAGRAAWWASIDDTAAGRRGD